MKISFYELEGWEQGLLEANFPADQISYDKGKLDQYSLTKKSDAEIISVFVNSRVDKTVLEAFPNLKFITTRSTGYDHIDLKACAEKGVVVGFVPGYGNNTVAEFAFGLILNLTRKVYQAIDQIKETESFNLYGLRGIDLKGKTIGIIGTGRIGKESAHIARGFGMNILGYDPFPDQEFAKESGLKYMPLEDVLKNSDVVTLHVAYNEQTHHLINKGNIGLIKKGAYLINTARGGLVETEALVSALQSGALAGAGIDVLEEEGETRDEMKFFAHTPNPKSEDLKTMILDNVLMKMPNVLVTPHNAFNSQEAFERILNTTIENIKGFEAGNLNPKNIAK
ncbi:MAG: NAD(P)-dependent oxidoreductase [Candidatus Pacebacteria bacterium]|nr:NAD(P)-dependent oxidoreductase [Candidatus Paceibacterota bacterium]